MKFIYRAILSLILLLGITTGIGYAAAEKYGQEIASREVTPLKDILANPKAYEGKLVTIEGKIANECSTGCWFYLKVASNDLTIYVDIGNSGFAIPQYVGKKVLVEGTVTIKEAGPMIQGRGVEIQ